MLGGAAYKGFGLSAQSMSSLGLSYNVGKLARQPQKLLNISSFPEAYTYLVPPHELAAKYLAISAYNGSFSIQRLKEMGARDKSMIDTLDFLVAQRQLHRDSDDRLYVSKKGFEQYGAIFSLLYSNNEH